MHRDQSLTVRLSTAEMTMLTAIRQAFECSKADAVVFSLEDMCERLGWGEDVGYPILSQDRAVCAAARNQQHEFNRRRSWAGRPPHVTPHDHRLLAALPDPPPQKEGEPG